ncbi:N-acetylmuramoyl-L-alanine amidase [Maribacter sp. R86514]|uniref:N-acetylmuramoyl-L-alanine amidase n=1 Tax=Maribacter sp. R86514 TaxID=3093854 RepID=UPI0037C781B5
MKKAVIIFLIFKLGTYNCSAQSSDIKRKIIVIDPGHGGRDSGTITTNGIQEKEVVLDIARSMVFWNRNILNNAFDIYLTRSKDTLISLSDRTRLAKHLKPDIFISLHCNHSARKSIKGVEIYMYDSKLKYSEISPESENSAQTILRKLEKNLGLKTNGIRIANFQVLRETIKLCPSLLLELGYLSNNDEALYLGKEENRNAIGLAVLMALKEE